MDELVKLDDIDFKESNTFGESTEVMPRNGREAEPFGNRKPKMKDYNDVEEINEAEVNEDDCEDELDELEDVEAQSKNNGRKNNGNGKGRGRATDGGKNDKKRRKNKNDTFGGIVSDILNNIEWKQSILLFIMGFFIFSDVFVENVVGKMVGTYNGTLTTQIMCICLLFLCLGFIIINLLVKKDII
jgi:hypothetical protein